MGDERNNKRLGLIRPYIGLYLNVWQYWSLSTTETSHPRHEMIIHLVGETQLSKYRGVDKSLAWPTSRFIFFLMVRIFRLMLVLFYLYIYILFVCLFVFLALQHIVVVPYFHSPVAGFSLLVFEVTWQHTTTRTFSRAPLDEWSIRRRDLYQTTHNTHNRQTSMSPWDWNPQFQQTSDRRPTP
jgi:hypothetical protein